MFAKCVCCQCVTITWYKPVWPVCVCVRVRPLIHLCVCRYLFWPSTAHSKGFRFCVFVCMCVCWCVSICRPCCAGGTATWLRPRYLRCPSCCQSRCCRNKPRVPVKRQRTRLPTVDVPRLDRSSGEPRGSSLSDRGLFVDLQLPLLPLQLHPPVLNSITICQIQTLFTHASGSFKKVRHGEN